MWFAALEGSGAKSVVGRANSSGLLEGSRDVPGLLAHDPFPDKNRPTTSERCFIAIVFTNSEEHRPKRRLVETPRNFGNICRQSPGISLP